MQEHERLVGKPSESQNQTAQNLNVGQVLPGQAMDLDKIPGLLGFYDAYLLWQGISNHLDRTGTIASRPKITVFLMM